MASASSPTSSEPPCAPPRVGRPRELEDPLNLFVYHPLASQLARLIRPTGISPNLVSIAGGLLVVAAAWAYTGIAWPQSVLLGFSFHLLWHVVDGADGELARLTGKASATGELVDGVCDYAGHIILYIALAAFLDDQIGGWAWLAASAAGASHIVQTNHAESQRRAYLWLAYGVPWLKHAQAAGDDVFKGRSWFSLMFGWMGREYIRLSQAMAPDAARIDAAVEAAAGDERRTRRIRRLARHSSKASLAFQKLLGPNPRTILLGVGMALGSPLYFFLAECVLLNLLLILSVRHHNVCSRNLAARLERGA